MLTKTQKEYKKQMEELQEQLSTGNNKEQGFYSYLERDYINTYYDPKKKHRKQIITSISLFGIIALIMTALSMYSWLMNTVQPQNAKNLVSITHVLDHNVGIHKEVGLYLQDIQYHKNKSSILLDYCIKNFNTSLENKTSQEVYFNTISDYSSQLRESINALNTMHHPTVMSDYHQIILQNFNTMDQIFILTLKIKNTNDATIINHDVAKINQLLSAYNLSMHESTTKMILVFDEIDMRYKKNPDGQLQYWWKN
jgi:hypothetical protein